MVAATAVPVSEVLQKSLCLSLFFLRFCSLTQCSDLLHAV
jgi:hypothetical protein